jgi:hypothetical protein
MIFGYNVWKWSINQWYKLRAKIQSVAEIWLITRGDVFFDPPCIYII